MSQTKTTKWLSFELETEFHDYLDQIAVIDDRSKAKTVKSLIKERAIELGILKEKKSK